LVLLLLSTFFVALSGADLTGWEVAFPLAEGAEVVGCAKFRALVGDSLLIAGGGGGT
jgi:hypothetical protein